MTPRLLVSRMFRPSCGGCRPRAASLILVESCETFWYFRLKIASRTSALKLASLGVLGTATTDRCKGTQGSYANGPFGARWHCNFHRRHYRYGARRQRTTALGGGTAVADGPIFRRAAATQMPTGNACPRQTTHGATFPTQMAHTATPNTSKGQAPGTAGQVGRNRSRLNGFRHTASYAAIVYTDQYPAATASDLNTGHLPYLYFLWDRQLQHDE